VNVTRVTITQTPCRSDAQTPCSHRNDDSRLRRATLRFESSWPLWFALVGGTDDLQGLLGPCGPGGYAVLPLAATGSVAVT
jgi:hypothetical protein